MQNDVLYNKIMNKVLIISVEFALIDPDDPLSGYVYTLKKTSMGPVAFKTMRPPSSAILEMLDGDGNVTQYEYTQGVYFDENIGSVAVVFQNLAIVGTYATDSWEIFEG